MKPGRELDRLVAGKVMNWQVMGYPPGRGQDRTKSMQPPYQIVSGDIPKYSTDIAAAWKVVEKMSPEWNIYVENDYRDGTQFYWSQFQNWASHETVHAVGNIAPHAICLAALKAVGYEIKGEK